MTETKSKNTEKKKSSPVVYVGNDKIELATNELATISQVNLLASKTPQKYIKKRKGRGKKEFDYVEINYVIAKLNAIFGFNWSVEILDKEIGKDKIFVQVRLKVQFENGREIYKDAFGGSDVKKSNEKVIDIADDLKSAESDGIKKAASMLGVAWDVYSGITKAENNDNKKSAPEEKKEEY